MELGWELEFEIISMHSENYTVVHDTLYREHYRHTHAPDCKNGHDTGSLAAFFFLENSIGRFCLYLRGLVKHLGQCNEMIY